MSTAVTLADHGTMTVREVAEALGVSTRVVHKWAAELYPESVRNGVATYLSEEQVTRIKEHLARSCKVDAVTELEMAEKARQVMDWMGAKIESLKAERDAAKHFGLHPKLDVFPYLRAHGYLTGKDIPTQDALDADYLALRETACPDGQVRQRAVVEARQLETWRTRVVPQIRRWLAVERAGV